MATLGTQSADVAFFRRSAPFFAALLALAFAAFWPTYIRPPAYEADFHVHFHGVALFLWSVMLIAQPILIRRGRWALHRQVGKLSYALVPWIVVSTLMLAHYRMASGLNPELLYFFAVQVGLLAAFVIAWGQAIRHRGEGGIHARYMVCTALAMVDPILARLLYNQLGIEPPLLQFITYGCMDVILLALWARDLRLGNGVRVFPAMLAVYVVAELPTFLVSQTQAWADFTQAFARLPIP